MWSETLANISKVLGPMEVDEDTGQGEINLAVSGTHWTYEVPTWMAGKYIEITAEGASVDVLFGTASTIEVVYGQVTGESSGELTVDANTGRRIVDGTTKAWLVPKTATHWSAEASGDGVISVGISSQKTQK
jgi:hypothetical protein